MTEPAAAAPNNVRTVGVLGAGQLGRMLALAGIPLGLEFIFYSDRPDDTARTLGDHIHAEYTDLEAIASFARRCDVVTFEFENVPAATAEAVSAAGTPIAPGPRSLAITQDRLLEKTTFHKLDVPTNAFHAVNNAADALAAIEAVGLPAVLKTRTLGYDGKGQGLVRTPAQAERVFDELGGVPLLAEAFVPFTRELSTISVRTWSGEVAHYPLTQNTHEAGILARSVAPAPNVSPDLTKQAQQAAERVMTELGHVGVLAIEWFEHEGRLLANECAPRVHNSGHWTQDAAATCQFENHCRAVCNWPLGPSHVIALDEKRNLICVTPGVI